MLQARSGMMVSMVAVALVPVLGGCERDSAGDRAAAQQADAAHSVPAEAELAAGYARADFAVSGMDCGGCAIAARAALKRLPGVDRAGAAYDERTGEGSAWAVYDPARATPASMVAALRELGYTAALKEG